MTMPRQAGFTLPELLIILALLVLVALVAVPAFGDLQEHTRQQSIRDELKVSLLAARTRAISRLRDVELCASRDSQSCQKDWSSGWIMRDAKAQKVLRVTSLTEQGEPLRWIGSRSSILYRANGTSPLSNGRFLQCIDDEVSWQLIINRQGRVREGNAQENKTESRHCP